MIATLAAANLSFFHKKGQGKWGCEVTKEGRGGVKVKILDNVLLFTVYISMYKYSNKTKV